MFASISRNVLEISLNAPAGNFHLSEGPKIVILCYPPFHSISKVPNGISVVRLRHWQTRRKSRRKTWDFEIRGITINVGEICVKKLKYERSHAWDPGGFNYEDGGG